MKTKPVDWAPFKAIATTISTGCLLLMAIESVRQTDIAKQNSRAISSIVSWIKSHVEKEERATGEAELLFRHFKQMKDADQEQNQ